MPATIGIQLTFSDEKMRHTFESVLIAAFSSQYDAALSAPNNAEKPVWQIRRNFSEEIGAVLLVEKLIEIAASIGANERREAIRGVFDGITVLSTSGDNAE